MSLLEWIGESYNPGPVGSVTTRRERRARKRGVAIFTGIVALGVLAIPYLLVLDAVPEPAGVLVLMSLGLGLYLITGYFVRLRPDTSNLGWFGGLMDNPFRYSDDINRLLLLFALLLLPGRLVATGVVDLITALRRPAAAV